MAASFGQHREFLIGYLRPQRLAVAVMSVLLLGSIALQLVTPLILSRFIDAARAGGAPDTLVRLAVLSLMVAVAGQLVSTCSAYASENVGWAATNKVREDLALHCLRLDLPFHNAKTPGEMIERVDGDVTQLSSFFSQFVLRVFGNAVLLVGILVLLFRADWRVGVVYSVFTVTALVILRRLIESAVPYWKEARQTSAILLGFLEERLSGTEDIRASGAARRRCRPGRIRLRGGRSGPRRHVGAPGSRPRVGAAGAHGQREDHGGPPVRSVLRSDRGRYPAGWNGHPRHSPGRSAQSRRAGDAGRSAVPRIRPGKSDIFQSGHLRRPHHGGPPRAGPGGVDGVPASRFGHPDRPARAVGR